MRKSLLNKGDNEDLEASSQEIYIKSDHMLRQIIK